MNIEKEKFAIKRPTNNMPNFNCSKSDLDLRSVAVEKIDLVDKRPCNISDLKNEAIKASKEHGCRVNHYASMNMLQSKKMNDKPYLDKICQYTPLPTKTRFVRSNSNTQWADQPPSYLDLVNQKNLK